MVAIPPQRDATLQAMYDVIAHMEKGKPKRDYLGASLIGHECERHLYYQYHHYECEPFAPETLLKFEDGHRTEELTANRLRQVKGIELHTHTDNGEQIGFSDLDGKFKGHYDGIIRGLKQAPKAWHIWECKASEPKKFNEFKRLKKRWPEKAVLEQWNYIYYAQAQVYMHYEKIDRHYLTVASAGGRDYDSCRTDYNKDVAEALIAKAKYVIEATQVPPKFTDNEDALTCKWCAFREICHGENTKRLPEVSPKWPF